MPRDVNGNYSLPTGNPVAPDTVIESVWANDTMNDIKNELSNSLSRDGFGGMRAPFRNADGTMLNPGSTWGNEPTSGWYRKTTNEFWYSVGNEDIFGITKTGVIVAPGKTLVGVDIPPPFPTGTRMLFNQTSAPVGWTKDVSSLLNNSALRIVTGAVSSGGVDGFSSVFQASRNTDAFALQIGNMPAHQHFGTTDFANADHVHGGTPATMLFAFGSGGDPAWTGVGGSTGGQSNSHTHTFATDLQGSGLPHSHNMSGMNLKYHDVIVATKD